MPLKRSKLEYLTPQQVKSLAAHCRTDGDRVMVMTAFYSGCRISEILALRPCDINFSEGTIEVPNLKHKSPPTKLISLPKQGLELLARFIKDRPHNKRLWPISRQTAYARIKAAGERAGIPGCYAHLLRDSFAIHWVKQGKDISQLSRQLHHKSTQMTEDRYLRWKQTDLRQTVNAIFRGI
jgi:integrase